MGTEEPSCNGAMRKELDSLHKRVEEIYEQLNDRVDRVEAKVVDVASAVRDLVDNVIQVQIVLPMLHQGRQLTKLTELVEGLDNRLDVVLRREDLHD